MTKQDVIRRIVEQTGYDPDASMLIVETFFEVVKGSVSQGETIYVRTFGSFGPKRRARKLGRNITANTALVVEAHTIPVFKPSSEFTAQVKARPLPEPKEDQPAAVTKPKRKPKAKSKA